MLALQGPWAGDKEQIPGIPFPEATRRPAFAIPSAKIDFLAALLFRFLFCKKTLSVSLS